MAKHVVRMLRARQAFAWMVFAVLLAARVAVSRVDRWTQGLPAAPARVCLQVSTQERIVLTRAQRVAVKTVHAMAAEGVSPMLMARFARLIIAMEPIMSVKPRAVGSRAPELRSRIVVSMAATMPRA